MSWASDNPELYEEMVSERLPEPWRTQVIEGEIYIGNVPINILTKAASEAEEDYFSSKVDAAVARNEDRMIEKSLRA
jgi:hypothetical protein